jgi:hypothetical protein
MPGVNRCPVNLLPTPPLGRRTEKEKEMSNISKTHSPNGDRYEIEGLLTEAGGWFQVDTWRDASYFGVWTNPFELKIYTHSEGDRTLEEYDTDAEYKLALNRTLGAYDKENDPDRRTMIDCVHAGRKNPAILLRFRKLGFEERCH